MRRMINDEFLGILIAFKGENEYVHSTNVLCEITEAYSDGSVEITFNAPIPGNPRICLRIGLDDIVRRALEMKGAETP
jgi:hypothetical protein